MRTVEEVAAQMSGETVFSVLDCQELILANFVQKVLDRARKPGCS